AAGQVEDAHAKRKHRVLGGPHTLVQLVLRAEPGLLHPPAEAHEVVEHGADVFGQHLGLCDRDLARLVRDPTAYPRGALGGASGSGYDHWSSNCASDNSRAMRVMSSAASAWARLRVAAGRPSKNTSTPRPPNVTAMSSICSRMA